LYYYGDAIDYLPKFKVITCPWPC